MDAAVQVDTRIEWFTVDVASRQFQRKASKPVNAEGFGTAPRVDARYEERLNVNTNSPV